MPVQDLNIQPTAVVMLNLGGPATLDDVEPFLMKLFADREIMPLPFQTGLGSFIAKRRAPKVRQRYAEIGGGSPILHWTRVQGEGMARLLDELSNQTAPHKVYPAFRYTAPFSEDALLQMKADGIRRAVAFTQYPQYSCATTGSSLNELWRAARRLGLEREFHWSVIDRWPTQIDLPCPGRSRQKRFHPCRFSKSGSMVLNMWWWSMPQPCSMMTGLPSPNNS